MTRRPVANIRFSDLQKKYRPSRSGKMCRRLAAVALLPVLASGIPADQEMVEVPKPGTTASDSAPAAEIPPPEPVEKYQPTQPSEAYAAADGSAAVAQSPVGDVPTGNTYTPTHTDTAVLSSGLSEENDPQRGPNSIPVLDADGPYLHDGPRGTTPLDRAWVPFQTLSGYLVPRETNLWSGYDGQLSLNAQPGIPFLTDVDVGKLPEFKAGPFYLDIISLGATAIYSDVESDHELPEDGFISSIDLKLRASLHLTEGLYFSTAASLYYLPESGKMGFYFFDRDYSFIRLAYETNIEQWDLQIYDEFQALHRLTDMLAPVESNEIDISGRYRLGRIDQVGLGLDEYSQDELILFRNTLGMRATRPIGSDLRLWTDFDHYDYWETTKFEDHRQTARFRAQLFYERDWRFTPYVGYTALTPNGYDGFSHEVYTGVKGFITPRMHFHGRVGYLWQDNVNQIERDDGVTYSASLIYDQSETVRHLLSGGSVHWLSDFGEEYLSNYLRYAIQTRFPFDPFSGSFSRLSSGGVYVQYSDTEYYDVPATTIESVQVGANLSVPLGNHLIFGLSGAYRMDESDDPIEAERWVYRANLNWKLGLRTVCTFGFQHEDVSRLNANLEEDMFLFQIRRSF